ncbi:hypothetical protein CCP2SC5_810003 [Azospirillaceae bacterium]
MFLFCSSLRTVIFLRIRPKTYSYRLSFLVPAHFLGLVPSALPSLIRGLIAVFGYTPSYIIADTVIKR